MRKRNLHNLSHQRLATFDMGELVPVGCLEVLPGDSMRHAASCLIRVSPLLAPVMHGIDVRLHNFFVPNRLLWDGWEDFITEGPDGESAEEAPTITVNTGTGWAEGSLADYLGVPTGVDDVAVSALPFRAYSLIWNNFYRDRDLGTELTVSTASGADTTTNTTLQKCMWEKDQFTAARPWPQKGAAVTLPLGTSAPVASDAAATDELTIISTAQGDAYKSMTTADAQTTLRMGAASGTEAKRLYADLQAATAAEITDLRRAIALQAYQEARAMYGHEYVDYLRYAFGVTSSDARLQRPEYLSGGKQRIAFSEVLQTGPDSTDDGVAALKGHGIAAMRSRTMTRFFEEHGWMLSLMSVRPRSVYGSGLHKHWFKSTKEDYYQRELEHIGMQEVYNKEVRLAHATPDGVFGYNDRYADYRHHPSYVNGEFRSSLNYFHLARLFSSDPALNATFVTCDPGKRIHADQTGDQLWVMINHSLRARRPVGYAGVRRVF